MVTFRDLTLEDQDMINSYFERLQANNSECSFTNLFIWRKCYHVQWAIVEGYLVILTTVRGKSWILPPFGNYQDGDLKKVMELLKVYFQEKAMPFVIRAIPEAAAEALKKEVPGWFWMEEEREIFDYIYRGEDLRLLKGKKYHGKRNHINQFKKRYSDYGYEKITAENIPEVKEFLERWCFYRQCKSDFDRELYCEKKAIYEAFSSWEQLKCTGGAMRVNGKIEAFTIGEQLNKDTVLIHIEKANVEIPGLYGVIHQEYLLHEWPDILYVNREEDMGDEGLRKAKLSFYPAAFARKWKAEYQEKDTLYCHRASDEDKEEVKRLWEYCFTDTREFTEWYFSRYYRTERTFGAFFNGDLTASVQMIPYELLVRGKKMRASYVVGLDTAPEYRRGGVGRKLLKYSMEEMRREKRCISLLMPFSPDFYLPLQWTFCYFKQNYVIDPWDLNYARKPHLGRAAQEHGTFRRVRMKDAVQVMQNIYQSYQIGRNGGILRGEEQWELLTESWELEHAVCYVLSGKEVQQAYMVYSIEGTVMRIHEMLYTGEQAKRECLDFIYGHRSHIVKAEWAAESGDTTFCYLNPGRSVCTLQPFLMARVVDVIQAWREFAVLAMKEPVIIRIEDELLEWNNAVFKFWETDGKKESQRLGEEVQWDYCMGIESFTQLLMGSSSLEELLTRGAIVRGGALEGEPLKSLFPKLNNDIQEYY